MVLLEREKDKRAVPEDPEKKLQSEIRTNRLMGFGRSPEGVLNKGAALEQRLEAGRNVMELSQRYTTVCTGVTLCITSKLILFPTPPRPNNESNIAKKPSRAQSRRARLQVQLQHGRHLLLRRRRSLEYITRQIEPHVTVNVFEVLERALPPGDPGVLLQVGVDMKERGKEKQQDDAATTLSPSKPAVRGLCCRAAMPDSGFLWSARPPGLSDRPLFVLHCASCLVNTQAGSTPPCSARSGQRKQKSSSD
ncbi:unnamed protein product [Pleuronectes platessa]|uniref:Uncharacterized protein n=1 Tax=Pleuronectes platessa TaxID=8262 RepID=A0A9N7VU85_PLEPL|nr:unnamed protein product [Pleuronectes platessa]